MEQWDDTMATHVRALLSLAQAARPSMREGGGGAIVAISSLGSARVFDAYSAFGTAKAAIETLVPYLAVECGPEGIRANCIRGGVVLTDLFKEIPEWEAIAAGRGRAGPVGRRARPGRHRRARRLPALRRSSHGHRPDALRRRRLSLPG